MAARHRYWVVLVLGSLGPGSLLWALPPCGPPGTITTVTAPDGGDYIAAFSDCTIYPSTEAGVVASSDYRSYFPQHLARGPRGRVHVADQTIIYRLEADGGATRIVGVPQHSSLSDDLASTNAPLLQVSNVLLDTVAALEARIAPGPMAFDRLGRLHFVDYVNRRGNLRTEARIARLEADGQVTTFCRPGRVQLLLFAALRSRGRSARRRDGRHSTHRCAGSHLQTAGGALGRGHEAGCSGKTLLHQRPTDPSPS